jgi:2-oxoglutarate ferredoxin oxidoreductase subunit alpha
MTRPAVLTGKHFMHGDHACAEGALAAGCRFFAGYPITPSTEVAEHLAARLPEVNGVFIQMEDELASMAAILGASAAGARSMTATSGPGLSLMMENLGLGVMLELPTLVVDVMRGSPSTGLPTLPGQSDVMQVRWGSHGDFAVIAYSPWSPQEMFDLTIKAFNMADRYRVPAVMLADEVVGHMVEKVTIPPADRIEHIGRKKPSKPADDTTYKSYLVEDADLVPPLPYAGEGYNVHLTGLTHDERGYPDMTAEAHDRLTRRLFDKIEKNADDIIQVEEYELGDARIVVVAYGCTARSARSAVLQARAKGIPVGLLRLVSIWPFPEKIIRDLATKADRFIVAEMNLGQIRLEVERVSHQTVQGVHHAGGAMIPPEPILAAIEEAAK